MFAGLENVQANPRRGWTALVSFTLQAAAVAAALAIPLVYPNALPDAFQPRRIFVPVMGRAPETVPANAHPGSGSGVSLAAHPLYVTQGPSSHVASPQTDIGPIGPPNIGLIGANPVIPGNLIGDVKPPEVHLLTVKPPRVSRAMEGYLIHRVEPTYPSIARVARVEGAVLIKAIISTEGTIEQARVVRGAPLLSPAALEAIKQWRYRPYFLNDKPVEVETEITVNFVLSR